MKHLHGHGGGIFGDSATLGDAEALADGEAVTLEVAEGVGLEVGVGDADTFPGGLQHLKSTFFFPNAGVHGITSQPKNLAFLQTRLARPFLVHLQGHFSPGFGKGLTSIREVSEIGSATAFAVAITSNKQAEIAILKFILVLVLIPG